MPEHQTDATPQPFVRALPGGSPAVDASAWIAPTAVIVGNVHLGPEVSIWYGSVLRAESEKIVIGAGSNLQDGVVAHVDPGSPLTLGRNVSVGHNAVLHGCTIGDDCLVGMGAIIMNGAVVGEGSLVAAGALITENAEIPPNSLVTGLPAKVRRPLTDEETACNRENAATYRRLISIHRNAG